MILDGWNRFLGPAVKAIWDANQGLISVAIAVFGVLFVVYFVSGLKQGVKGLKKARIWLCLGAAVLLSSFFIFAPKLLGFADKMLVVFSDILQKLI